MSLTDDPSIVPPVEGATATTTSTTTTTTTTGTPTTTARLPPRTVLFAEDTTIDRSLKAESSGRSADSDDSHGHSLDTEDSHGHSQDAADDVDIDQVEDDVVEEPLLTRQPRHPVTATPTNASVMAAPPAAPTKHDIQQDVAHHVITTSTALASPWRNVIKATAAFLLACSLTFVDPLQQRLGYLSHFAAVAILFFHPCKSLGAMLEATLMGFLGVGFGVGVDYFGSWIVDRSSSSSSSSLSSSSSQDLPTEMPHHLFYATVVCILLLVFVSTFVLAFIRARWSQPAIFTGKSTNSVHWTLTI